MRGFLAGLATLVAILGIIVAVPTTWGATHIVSEDGFAAAAASAAKKSEVQDYFAQQITNEVVQSTTSLAGPVAKPLATSYTRSPAFVEDFTEIARQQHQWMFTEPAPDQSTHVMEMNLTPMVNRVLESSPINVKVSQDLTVPIDQHELTAGSLQSTGSIVNATAIISVAAALIGAVLGLLFARRRLHVVMWLSIGGILAGVVGWLIAQALPRLVVKDGPTGGGELSAAHVMDVVLKDILSTLGSTSIIVGIVGAAVMVIGLLGGIVTKR